MLGARRRIMGAVGLLLGALAASAAAETYPIRPVRLIVPFPPGGSNDIVGRMIGAQLSDRLGQQFVIDNRGGAGATIGAALAATAPPDGYTLLLISASFVYNPALYKHLPYDPATAFAPVAMLGSGPVALLVYPKLPVNSLKDLVELARREPGQLNYASAGVGSLQHLAGELFRIQAHIDIVHVPYKGGGPAMMDVAAGQAQITFATYIQAVPLVKGGTLKMLGIGSAARLAVLPDTPTIAEAGVPGYEASNWWGVLAPAGTPNQILEQLHDALSEILGSAETQQRFSAEGAEAVPMSRDAFGRFIAAETAKWAQVVTQAGITPE
jgi:tripartite-type tricarboxylate transporter receptor subunit TctC